MPIFFCTLAFCYAALITGIKPGAFVTWFDFQRLVQLILWGLAFLALAISKTQKSGCGKALIVPATMLSLAVIGNQPGWALAEAAHLLGLLVFAWWICLARRKFSLAFDHTATFALTYLSFTNALMPLLLYGRVVFEGMPIHVSQLFYGFSNHRFFTQAQLLVVPMLALPMMAHLRSPLFRGLTTLTAILCWSLVFAAGSRAAYVAMICGATTAWFWLGQSGKSWVNAQARFATLGWGVFFLLFHALPWIVGISILTDNSRLNNLDSAIDSSGRIAMWIESVHLIAVHPLLGIGPMQYAGLPNRAAGGPHNVPLQLVLEWGIPLGVLMIAIPLFTLWKLGKLAKTGGSLAPLRTCLFLTLLVAATDALFEGNLSVPYSAVLMAVIIGWAWGTYAHNDDQRIFQPTPITRIGGYVARIILALLGSYLIWFAIHPANRINSHNLQYLETSKSALMPRMWAQGLIGLPYDIRYPTVWFNSRNIHESE